MQATMAARDTFNRFARMYHMTLSELKQALTMSRKQCTFHGHDAITHMSIAACLSVVINNRTGR